ncbi:MAG: hypothetical protein ACK4TA_13745 [Saprospiraceae bacterium]
MRRYFTLKYLIYLLPLFVFASCDFSSLKDPIVITEVEDEFDVDMWESLAPTFEERNLVIKIESAKTEKCLNYRIDYQVYKDGNRLKVALNNIIKPLDCVPGETTVKTDVGIGYLPNSLYSFNIDLKNTVFNDGQLIVRSDSYTLDMYSKNGFSLKRGELLRVPEGAIWGYVTYPQNNDESLANQWVEDLKKISQVPLNYRSGYYGHFTINNLDRKVTVNEQPLNNNVKTFLYHYTDDANKLKDLVNRYRQNYGNRLTIRLLNSKGEVL